MAYNQPVYPMTYPNNYPIYTSSPYAPISLQQPATTHYIPGKVIGNISEVTPNDVSMGGQISLFPTSDYKTIYAKQWSNDGTIRTVEYKPVEVPVEQVASASDGSDLKAYIDAKFEEMTKLIKSSGRANKLYIKPEQKETDDGSKNSRS